MRELWLWSGDDSAAKLLESIFGLLDRIPNPQIRSECLKRGAGVWVCAQVDPLVVFVGVVSELGWG